MSFYHRIKYDVRDLSDRKRSIEQLLALKDQVDSEIPDKNSDEELLLATLNIRDFEKMNRRGFGNRTKDYLERVFRELE